MVERLAVEQAVYNAIGADLKTGVDGNLRGDVNDHYLDLYDATGATSFEVRVNGQKVGTYSFPKVKGRAGHVDLVVRVTDFGALQAHDDDDWMDFCSRWLDHHLAEVAEAYVRSTGDTLPGVELSTVETPATPDGIRRGGTLRVDAGKVAEALGPALPDTVAGLLGGGA
jgi:hypothetical protein